jgi:hypothetical protein
MDWAGAGAEKAARARRAAAYADRVDIFTMEARGHGGVKGKVIGDMEQILFPVLTPWGVRGSHPL